MTALEKEFLGHGHSLPFLHKDDIGQILEVLRTDVYDDLSCFSIIRVSVTCNLDELQEF